MVKRLSFALLALTMATPPAAAQDRKEPGQRTFYRIEFNFRDGSPAAAQSGRRYLMTLDNESRGVYRVGTRVPYVAGSVQASPGANVSTQYQYFDAGVNITCRSRDLGGKIALEGDLEVSSVTPEKGSSVPNPIVHSIRLNVTALVPLRQPTVIATIDDPVTMKKFDVEVTVTKVE